MYARHVELIIMTKFTFECATSNIHSHLVVKGCLEGPCRSADHCCTLGDHWCVLGDHCCALRDYCCALGDHWDTHSFSSQAATGLRCSGRWVRTSAFVCVRIWDIRIIPCISRSFENVQSFDKMYCTANLPPMKALVRSTAVSVCFGHHDGFNNHTALRLSIQRRGTI